MKTVVVLGLSHLSVPEKISTARSIVVSMTGNPAFPTPNPALTVVTAAINACDTAYIAALTGGVDDTANMHVKETAMELQLKLLAAYIEGIANANPATSQSVVLSSGFRPKGRGGAVAREFHAKATEVPGEIRLATKFVQRATYQWQMCTDISLENWEVIGQGTRATFIKSGLVPGKRYYFRVAVIDKNGMGPWTDAVSQMAH